MKRTERDPIKQAQKALGPIVIVDCQGMDIVSAHRFLGSNARSQIHKILGKRLDDLGGTQQTEVQILRARNYQNALEAKAKKLDLAENIRLAVQQYQLCLKSWAEGAMLQDFHHNYLEKSVGGKVVTDSDLATLLQEDEVGCQTGALREQNGGVILWHCEEDYEETPNQRFDALRLFQFQAADGRGACGFVYPDLLPGPTFGWQIDDYAQAVDTLHVRSIDFKDAILPNTLAWISLYLGPQVSRQQLAQILGPFQGGYSLTAVYKKEGRIHVEKVEFANSQINACTLSEDPGAYLFQTNVIRDLSIPIGSEENTSPENRLRCEIRMKRTDRFLQAIQYSQDPRTRVLRMLASDLGGDIAYANLDVKAHLVHRMTPEGTTIIVGAGAHTRDGHVYHA